jgi:hypothetical protein
MRARTTTRPGLVGWAPPTIPGPGRWAVPTLRNLVPLLAVVIALGAAGDSNPIEKSAKNASVPAPSPSTPAPMDSEVETMAFVREHHPELARVLGSLKARNQAEYRKAIGELSTVARNLAEVKTRNPKRYELALDAWKARSRVELLAAQLAGSPTEELRSQLRTAIEFKVDAEIRRQQFDLAQAEETARKLRQSLDHLENHRDEVVEARFRALQPRKAKGGKPGKEPDQARPVTVPSSADKRENRP